MIVGIACTVVTAIVAIVAIYQTMAARTYRDAAIAYAAALENWKKALTAQCDQMVLANQRYAELEAVAIAAGIIRARSPSGTR